MDCAIPALQDKPLPGFPFLQPVRSFDAQNVTALTRFHTRVEIFCGQNQPGGRPFFFLPWQHRQDPGSSSRLSYQQISRSRSSNTRPPADRRHPTKRYILRLKTEEDSQCSVQVLNWFHFSILITESHLSIVERIVPP